MKILLDYLFPITAIEPTAAASTAFLKQVCVIGKPKDVGVTKGVATLCTTQTAVDAILTAQGALEVAQLLSGGMSRVYVMAVDDLDLAAELTSGVVSDFFTILITSDFADAEITAADFGTAFKGVIGVSSTDDAFLKVQAAIGKRVAFHTTTANKGKNMFFAFGKLLSNSLNWKNQQYVEMPLADDVATLGAAETLFDDRISFVISDDEYSKRLAFFGAGGKAIVAPYISKNLEIDLQSKALNYIASNQPGYTKTAAALLEDELQKVIESYFEKDWIEAGTVEVTLEEDNFEASGSINIAEPKALWRIMGEMRATL